MPDTTPITGLRFPLLTETADVPRDIEAVATDAETHFGMAPYAALQQGVISGLEPDPTALGMKVNGGTAVIRSPASDDPSTALLYVVRVSPLTDFDVFLDAAHATLPRIDQVVMSLTPQAGLYFHKVTGVATAGADLDDRLGAIADADIDDLFPDGWMRITDIFVAATDTAIGPGEWRDRRTFARGFKFRSEGSAAVGPVTAQTDFTNGQIRAEIGPDSKLSVRLTGTTSSSAQPNGVVVGLWRNGVIVSEKTNQQDDPGFSQATWEWANIGNEGSNLLLLTGRVGGSGTITVGSTTFSIEEDIGGYKNNGVT